MSAALAVVPVRPDEIDRLADLHASCFERPWGPAALARLLATPGAFGLLGRLGRAPAIHVGFALGRVAAGESEILSIGVLPDYRRRGFARELIAAVGARALADGAEALLLEVDLKNHAANALYRRLGFVEVGRRPGYYRQTDGRRRDALILRLALPG